MQKSSEEISQEYGSDTIRNMETVSTVEGVLRSKKDSVTSADQNCKEMVNHPDHYNNHPSGVECIDVVEHFSFNIGNAMKYLWRSPYKGKQLEDLKKARWYIEREIEKLKKAGVCK